MGYKYNGSIGIQGGLYWLGWIVLKNWNFGNIFAELKCHANFHPPPNFFLPLRLLNGKLQPVNSIYLPGTITFSHLAVKK
jgi:hypothetical protein